MPDDFVNGTGQIAENIVDFGRVLRGAGVPVGPSRIVDAVRAVEISGLDRRHDFFWALHSVFVSRREQQAVFKVAFDEFWRDRRSDLQKQHSNRSEFEKNQRQIKAAATRVAQAMRLQDKSENTEIKTEYERDSAVRVSKREILASKDFAQMNTQELAEAKRAIATMRLPVATIKTRRFQSNHTGSRLDLRRMMRTSLAAGGELVSPIFQQRKQVVPPIVALCDISGSMEQYSRLILHFLHMLTNSHYRVQSFVFGTRLTNITRALKHKDPDEALIASGELVSDWSGGTRIASTLREFNKNWSRRVTGQGAILLLITDGLERDSGADLTFEMERLQKSCRQLIWLNPLLRFAGFEARASGVKAMLPHVDQFRPIHSLNTVSELCDCLSQTHSGVDHDPKYWLKQVA